MPPLNPGATNPIPGSGVILDPNAVSPTGQPLFGMLDQKLGTPPPVTPPPSDNPTAPNMPGYEWTKDKYGNLVETVIDTSKKTETGALGDFVPYTQTAVGKNDYEKLKALNESLGILSPEEEAAIQVRANNEGLKYDTLIAQAKEEKRQGRAKANVRAGQSGGFENTQIAGVAALTTTEGGTFEGQGGNLEEVKSAYDLNIQNLEVQRAQAISAARETLREAKLTGNKEAFTRATSLFELAQKSHDDAINMATKKIEALKTIAETNVLNKKTPDAFFKGSDIVQLMKTIPEGQSIQMTDPSTGQTYTVNGASKSNPNVITFTDDKGVVTARDKNTGAELWKTAPGVGKTKSNQNTSINFPRQDRTPIYDAKNKQVGFQTYNPITAAVQSFDLSGKPIDFPEGGRLGSVSSGFNNDSGNDIWSELTSDNADTE